MDPLGVIGGQTSGGDDTMHVGMMLQLLVPGVQDAEEADLSAKVLAVCGDFDQGLGGEAKQQAVDDFLVLQSQWGQFVWECEDDVGIGRSQQFGAARIEPAVARFALTLRTMPVAARIIRGGAVAAPRARIDMAAQRGGAAS